MGEESASGVYCGNEQFDDVGNCDDGSWSFRPLRAFL